MVYPSTCETIVNAFLCYELPDGRRYLLEDFNVSCDGTYAALMFPAAGIALLCYAVGVPASWLLCLAGRCLRDHAILHSNIGHESSLACAIDDSAAAKQHIR